MAAASSRNWRTPTPPAALQPGHGAKRRAARALDEELELDTAQRLAKRFHLLNIDNNGRLWVDPNNAVPDRDEAHQPSGTLPRAPSDASVPEHMHVEDTKDRVYIHNLDAELAEVSTADDDDERLIFLPDIDRKLNRVPLQALLGDTPERLGNEVVLYSVPKALSVPEDKDSVRRAIIESRARAREELGHASRDASLHDDMPDVQQSTTHTQPDDDAMDLG